MWRLCEGGRNRCQECGTFVKRAWFFFASTATWTHCYCETCVEEKLK